MHESERCERAVEREDLISTWLLSTQQADPLGLRGTTDRGPVEVLLLHEKGHWLRVHALSGRHVEQAAGCWSFRGGALLLDGTCVELVNLSGLREARPLTRQLSAWRVGERTLLGNAAAIYVQHGGRVIPKLGLVMGYTRVDGTCTLLPRKWDGVPHIVRDILGRAGHAGLDLD